MRLRLPDRRHPLVASVLFLLVVFLVLFPKGGLKLGSVPITWGYLVVAASAPVALIGYLFFRPLRINAGAGAALATMLPFQMLFVYSYKVNGIGLMEYAVSVLVTFFFLPVIFLFIYPSFFPLVDGERLRRLLCGSIFLAAAWGIFLFFWRPLTGKLLEIPYLTVNGADFGKIELTKHIARGAFLKLISTYNNGNVYGVATLILMPLYTRLEPRRSRRWVVRVALLLTLSRTVWAGLVVEQLLSLGEPVVRSLGTFPRLRMRGAGKRLAMVGAVMVLILVAVFSSTSGWQFLLDPTLGGRTGELAIARDATLLPSVPVTGFSEVLFASALTNYGYVGLAAFALIFAFPFGLMVLRPSVVEDPLRRAAAKGLLLYVIVSASDGATNLIPVMAFYWFVYSVLLYGFPGAVLLQRVTESELSAGAAARLRAGWFGGLFPARG